MGHVSTNVRLRSAGLIAASLIPALATFGQSTITGITTFDFNTGSTTTRNDLPGFSNVGTGTPYDITYNGIERQITSITTATATYAPAGTGLAYMRRSGAAEDFPNTNPNQTSAWNALLSGNNSTSAHTVSGQYINTMEALFTGQNLLTGTENLFVNSGDANNVSGNIERVDYIFPGGFAVTAQDAFSIFERGRGLGDLFSGGANGGFKVVAITGIDGSNIPTAFGSTIISIGDDSYSNGGVGIGVTPFRYDVFRYGTAGGPELDALGNVDIGPQGISGVLIEAQELAALDEIIYGYSILPEDVNLSGNLLNWADNSVYPQNSGTSVDIDLVAGGAARFTNTEVPEASTTAAMVALGAMVGGAFLRRRMDRK